MNVPKILAIDISWSGVNGWVLWREDPLRSDPILEYGTFQAKAGKQTEAERVARLLQGIYENVHSLVTYHRPDYVVWESTDWHQDLAGRRQWKKWYAQERLVQRCSGRAEAALVLAARAAQPGVKLIELGVADARSEYGSRGRTPVSKEAAAQLLASDFPDRLWYDPEIGRDDCYVIDRRNNQPVPHHVTDAMVLADVTAARLNLAERIEKAT